MDIPCKQGKSLKNILLKEKSHTGPEKSKFTKKFLDIVQIQACQNHMVPAGDRSYSQNQGSEFYKYDIYGKSLNMGGIRLLRGAWAFLFSI
jgi:hypothetical protein